MSVSRVIRAAIALSAIAAPAFAQDTTSTPASCGCVVIHGHHTPNEFERRSSGEVTAIQSRPRGALGDNIGFGYGANGTFLFNLDRGGILALRADAGFLQYGRESKRVPLSETVGGRIQVDVHTDNDIVPLSLGLQITSPKGFIRPYANAGVGGQFFYTNSAIGGSSDSYDFASTTNQWDATSMWVAGGGVYIPVYQRGIKVMIDAGAQYVNGGTASYLKPGSIQDLPNAQIAITPMTSETHMLIVRLGVKIGL